MELEVTILERLQELRRWQIEQQERLLKQQQEQRELLSVEQERMYQALGLSVHSVESEDSFSAEANSSPFEDAKKDRSESMISGSSFRDERPESSEASPARENGRTPETTRDRSTSKLNVPPLRLTTGGHLNFQSSVDGFSPRSEIPNDSGEPSIVTISARTPEKIGLRTDGILIEGVEPLPADKPPKKLIALDDLPVPSPKKDFKTLLEERLRDCEANSGEASDDGSQRIQIKRPFLRKGEGLARFKPNPSASSSNRRGRPRSASVSACVVSSSGASKNNNRSPRLRETPKSSKVHGKPCALPATAQAKLSLKNVAPPKNKARSKSVSAVPTARSNYSKLRVKPSVDLNVSSDMETKSRRELEEMRIFELLEEKAENSSFCSNSSTVLALFRQSTPRKAKSPSAAGSNNRETTIRSEASDAGLEDIVRTTKSNMILAGSPITKIRETLIQKDYVISQWDSRNNENIDTSNSNGVSNRAIAAGTYKSTKHTTVQFNNNNNSNNNNNNNGADNDKQTINANDRSNFRENSDRDEAIDKRRENFDAEKDANVSLHVRFSEYNEYKTIGLTDTSIMSNDSNPPSNYSEDKAWSDRSSTSPDSSDVEVVFSRLNTGGGIPGERLIDRKEQRFCDEETSDRTTDNEDEDCTSVCSNEESYEEENTTITEIDKDEPRKSSSRDKNESGSTLVEEHVEITANEIDDKRANDTIFNSELLKTRLAELEREIEIFRKENAALSAQRKKLQDEARQLEKDRRTKEERLENERRCNVENLQEEKKRLAREKAALENRLRDAREKSIQNKHERQETQSLREQLDELREEIGQKESRWQASQARQKSQIRVLQTENARLKQELEKIRASRTSNSRNRRAQAFSNARSIHQINKQLDKKKIMAKKDSSSDEEKTTAQAIYEKETESTENVDLDGSKTIVYEGLDQRGVAKCQDEARKKRNMYASLLNEATEGLRGNESITLRKEDGCFEKFQRATSREDEEGKASEDTIEDSVDRKVSEESANGGKESPENTSEAGKSRSPIASPSSGNILQEPRRWSDVPICQTDRNNRPTIKKEDIREVKCPDGHLEYWYPNGNVKKIYPDRNVVKMIYYNGDVRENLDDGSVKYFYASTRTWHTTLPDGLEILEFPDGQVERRTKDGTNEVCFPDGSVRLLHVDGTEKWVLPDGTVAETFPDGNKILSFPNGQREVHTKEHKRREYPDGTVKFVYPDGTQETRYSTGRVRVKDKDGNLLVDVQH